MSLSATTWEKIRIGDLGNVITGRTPSSSIKGLFGDAYPFITPTDMHQGKYARLTHRSLSEDGKNLLGRNILPANSICVSCIGWQMGEVIMTDRPSFSNQQINAIIVDSQFDAAFIYYSLVPRKEELLSLGATTGVRTPIINKGTFCDLPIHIPPLPLQRRIASILSAYDELIENNRRRIRILEDMARSLYREWFVKFRFPGHEQVRMVKSELGEVPEGWEVKAFSAIADYLNGYAFKPKDLGEAGKPIIKIKELKAGISADTPRNTGETIPAKYKVQDSDVLFSWSADLDAYYWSGGEGFLNQHLFKVIPNPDVPKVIIYYALKESMPRFRALSLGATMHHIKRAALDQVFTLMPPIELRNRFMQMAEPMHERNRVLSKEIAILRRTRDLLLPRLMSGQIELDVEE